MGRPKDGGESRDRQGHRRRAALCQPLRMRIARRLRDGEGTSAEELAAELGVPRGRVAYHLGVLIRCGALRVVPRRNPASPRYRWDDDAQWARQLLAEEEAPGRMDRIEGESFGCCILREAKKWMRRRGA